MKGRRGKIVLLLSCIALFVLFYAFDLRQYLTLSYVKASRAKFEALYLERRNFVVASYMVVYILVTSFSLPGAAVMTLAGGAIFGVAAGTVIVSFASSIGATLACLVSRHLLRDWVEARFGGRLRAVNEGIGREGIFYLFTLRLIPVFPFWLVNLLLGLTKIRLRTIYWVSQIGMLPATVVYVNAGRELGRIDSLSGILSPRLIISLTLLGLFPLAAKKTLGWFRARG